MKKFNKGDKVVVVRGLGSPDGYHADFIKRGKEYIVDDCRGGYTYITLPDGTVSGGWDNDRFKLVNAAGKFKVGDTVKVMRDSLCPSNVGLIGKVVSFDGKTPLVYFVKGGEGLHDGLGVKVDGPKGNYYRFFGEKDLQAVEEGAPSMPDTKYGFTIGDRVVVQPGSMYEDFVGKVGTVVAFYDYKPSVLVDFNVTKIGGTVLHAGPNADRKVPARSTYWFIDVPSLKVEGAPGTIPADTIEIGTFILIMEKYGKLQPSTAPRVYTSSKQAKAVALTMAEKHPGTTFKVFKAVASAETEEVKTVTHKAVFKDAA
jgi:hypothetical protein